MKTKLLVLVVLAIITAGLVFSMSALGQESYNIPQWIKNNAKWWSEGQISDSEFIKGIQYLIDNNILQVNNAGSNELTKQAQELQYYRAFNLYNYLTYEHYKVWFTLPSLYYFEYRDNPNDHVPATVTDTKLSNVYYLAGMNSWGDVKFIADQLRKISGNDDELFANLVMQMVHQLKYVPTLYTKFPTEVFVEGSGDCDTLAVFAATVMYAGGLDVVILDALVPSSPESTQLKGGHALVGVKLSQVQDVNGPWYEDLDKGRYYLAEATWPLDKQYLDPWQYQVGFGYVGDNPWKDKIKIIDYVYSP